MNPTVAGETAEPCSETVWEQGSETGTVRMPIRFRNQSKSSRHHGHFKNVGYDTIGVAATRENDSLYSCSHPRMECPLSSAPDSKPGVGEFDYSSLG